MILTIREIKSLAQIAGFEISKEPDELETEIVIDKCPEEGIFITEFTKGNFKNIAWMREYPDDGIFGLGEELEADDDGT